jgi:hypothetical protein
MEIACDRHPAAGISQNHFHTAWTFSLVWSLVKQLQHSVGSKRFALSAQEIARAGSFYGPVKKLPSCPDL